MHIISDTIALVLIAVAALFCIMNVWKRIRYMKSEEKDVPPSAGLQLFLAIVCIIAIVSLSTIQYGPFVQLIAVLSISITGISLNYYSKNNEEKQIWSPRKVGENAQYPMQIIFILSLTMAIVSFAASIGMHAM